MAKSSRLRCALFNLADFRSFLVFAGEMSVGASANTLMARKSGHERYHERKRPLEIPAPFDAAHQDVSRPAALGSTAPHYAVATVRSC